MTIGWLDKGATVKDPCWNGTCWMRSLNELLRFGSSASLAGIRGGGIEMVVGWTLVGISLPREEGSDVDSQEMFWCSRLWHIVGGDRGRRGIKEFASIDRLEGCVNGCMTDTKGKINSLNTTLLERKTRSLEIYEHL